MVGSRTCCYDSDACVDGEMSQFRIDLLFTLSPGGVLGSCTAAAMSHNKFKSVPEVIMQDMTEAQRESLARTVGNVLQDLRVEDVALLLPLVLNNPATKETVLKAVITFFQNEMNQAIID